MSAGVYGLPEGTTGEGDTCIVRPDDLGRFVLAHRHPRWVCFDAAFTFWGVEQPLRSRGEDEAVRAWWQLAGEDRLHDPMLLDLLVRLARDDTNPHPRDLTAVARDITGQSLSPRPPASRRRRSPAAVMWNHP